MKVEAASPRIAENFSCFPSGLFHTARLKGVALLKRKITTFNYPSKGKDAKAWTKTLLPLSVSFISFNAVFTDAVNLINI